jgi:hypothetical protein
MVIKWIVWGLIIALFVSSTMLLLSMIHLRRLYQDMILAEGDKEEREKTEKYRTAAFWVGTFATVLIVCSLGTGGYVKSLADFCT